jgi:hypothetical protein
VDEFASKTPDDHHRGREAKTEAAASRLRAYEGRKKL